MSADPNDPSSKVDLERRRVPLERKISLKFKEFRGFITEYSQNLSMGGMFIRTSDPKPVGTIFDFELSLTDDFKLVQGIGEVIWVRATDDGPERPSGMGVRFLDLSSESRRLIQRIVEEQVAHGGTPFELEPPGFPPPPLRQTPTAPRPKPGTTGAQSTLFHPTAAPVTAVPPLPARTPPAASPAPPRPAAPKPPAAPAAPSTPSPPPVVAPPSPLPPRAAAPLPSSPADRLASAAAGVAAAAAAGGSRAELPDIDAFPDLDPPELPIPELATEGSELLPALDDFESETAEGFDLVDESATASEAAAGGATAASAAVGAAAATDAAAASPGGWPRGRVPSGFDEVARAFSEPAKAVDPEDETVRFTPLAMPLEPPRPATPVSPPPPRASAYASPPPPRPSTYVRPPSPVVEPAPRVTTPEDAPVRRPPPRRRSSFLPIVATLVLLLLAGVAVVYFGFPELLPEWARAPQLADARDGEAGADAARPASAAGSQGPAPDVTSSPAAPLAEGAAAVPAPSPGTGSPEAAASAAPTTVSPAGDAAAAATAGAPATSDGAAASRSGFPVAPPRARFSSVEEIWGQRSSVGTVITIVTNGKVPAEAFSHFRLDGGSPREVIRLRDVDDSYRRTSIPVGTAEVKQVRLGYHGNELHVVLDLVSPRVQLLQLTPVDNRLELVLARQ